MGALRAWVCRLTVVLGVAVVGVLWVSSAAWAALAEVTTGSASNITGDSATMSGTVNPGGMPVISCRFEYGALFFLGKSVPCSPDPGSGNAPVEVSAELAGLQSGLYKYRLAVTNADGTAYGELVRFLTLLTPRVEQEWASAIGKSTATVNALLRPFRFPTTYRFEYGLTTAYGLSVPIPDGSAGTEELVTVSEALSGLRVGAEYHYRVVASNEQGTTDGPDAVFITRPGPVAASPDSCSNAQFRVGGLSENLPDCRAFEMVSPLDKNGSPIGGDGEFTAQSSADGERARFQASAGFADAVGSANTGPTLYMASRGADGWGTHAITPPSPATSYQVPGFGTVAFAFTGDLEHGLVSGYGLPGADPGTGAQNLYREDDLTRSLETVTLTSNPDPNKCSCVVGLSERESLIGYSSDMGVVAFQTAADLLPEASGATKLYEWDHGHLRVADVLPDGSIPASGARGVSVSDDGSRILFMATPEGSSSSQLYMRKDGSSTVWVSRSEASVPNPEPQEVAFDAASRDGARVLFSSSSSLLDSDPGGEGTGLYLYTDGPNPEAEPNLTFIGRWTELRVLGMSDDAGHIYFYQDQTVGNSGVVEEEGVYLWDRGTLHFIATTASANDLSSVRLSSDGRRMAFLGEPSPEAGLPLSNDPELTKPAPNENTGFNPRSGYGWVALYQYDEGTEKVTCVSCPSNGEAMTADVVLMPEYARHAIGTGASYHASGSFSQRYMSSDGRYVFFTSSQSLVRQDTNGLPDVYEYDADTGRVRLISSGTGESGSWFEDASENGSDVFFLTEQRLTGWDTDTLTDLYDARVNGGFPEPPPAPVACDGDACQGVPSAVPSFNTASGFAGLGNVVVKPEIAKAKKKAKPRKRRTRHRRHGKRAKQSAAKRASGRAGR